MLRRGPKLAKTGNESVCLHQQQSETMDGRWMSFSPFVSSVFFIRVRVWWVINNDNNLFFLAKDSQTASTRDGRRRCCFQFHQSPRQFPVDCFFSFRLFFSTEQHSNHPLCHSFAISLFTLFSIQFNLSISYPSPCCCLLSLRLGRIPHPAATYYTHPLPLVFF